MAAIRGRDTDPEMMVRRALHADGFRYRTHVGGLPGRPDVVLPRYRAAVFVNGCFWHCHECATFRWPVTRAEFWKFKLETNRQRDLKSKRQLRELGWRVATVWECAIRSSAHPESTLEELERWITGGTDELELGQ